jgi:hypothetical protein
VSVWIANSATSVADKARKEGSDGNNPGVRNADASTTVASRPAVIHDHIYDYDWMDE